MIFQVTASGRPKPGRLLSFKPFGVQICRWAFLNIWGNTEPQAPSPDLGRMQGRGGMTFWSPTTWVVDPSSFSFRRPVFLFHMRGLGQLRLKARGRETDVYRDRSVPAAPGVEAGTAVSILLNSPENE